MRIVHISDVHIRNLKYHDDYRRVFDDLYEKLLELKPDLVINTGDVAHTKTDISPEFVDLCSEHIRTVAEIAPYHILLGNHDLNLQNPSRRDAISPIVDSIDGTTYPIYLHKDSGHSFRGQIGSVNYNIWAFSCADQDNFPQKKDWDNYAHDVNIGLYHGSLMQSETDIGWRMTEADDDLKLFTGLDFVLLGDIHKHQFLDPHGRVAYAGSLIQQNFGETPDKGFLIWDIESKDEFSVKHVKLNGDRKFFTVRLNDDLSVPNLNINPNSRVRIISPKPCTLVEQQAFEKEVREKFNPFSVISLTARNTKEQAVTRAHKLSGKTENLRDPGVQEKLIKKYLEDAKLSEEVMNKILEINSHYHMVLEKNEDVVRHTQWDLDSLAWNNMFNYGEDNILDLHRTKGVIGMFAPNSSGKSSLIDIITESLFDKTTKGISKNVFLVNDNKDSAQMVAKLTIGTRTYIIERVIDRVKYGKKKFNKEREWGKTSLNFYEVLEDETTKSLNGTMRSATEKNIRKLIGSFDDFLLTTFLAQSRDNDIIKCKDTDRRKILSRFLDLDMFEQKEKLAKDESKKYFTRLKDFEDNNLEMVLETERLTATEIRAKIDEHRNHHEQCTEKIKSILEEIATLRESKPNISCSLDGDEIKQREVKATSAIKKLNNDLARGDMRLDELRDEIQGLQNDIDLIPIDKLRMSLEKLAKLRALLVVANSELKVNMTSMDVSKRDIRILDNVPCGDKFPKCKFLVGAVKKKSQIDGKQEKIDKTEKSVSKIETEVDKLQSQNIEEQVKNYETKAWLLKNNQTTEREIKLKMENIKLRVRNEQNNVDSAVRDYLEFTENEMSLIKNKNIDKLIDSRVSERVEEQSLRAAVEKALMDLNKDLGAKENIIERISSELESLKEVRTLCDAYEHYIIAMGKNGIAYQILVDRLPMLNDEINKILSSVTEFNVFLEHNDEEQSIKLQLQYADYKSRPLELGGGAERELASIAIRTALLSVTSLPKTNMFVIDEGFGKLDPKNMDNVSKMFDYLRSVFDHVIIISHIDILKDMVDTSIEISSDKEGYSHIEVC